MLPGAEFEWAGAASHTRLTGATITLPVPRPPQRGTDAAPTRHYSSENRTVTVIVTSTGTPFNVGTV